MHWLHTNNYQMTAGVLESLKEPLENRVWFTYWTQAGGDTRDLEPPQLGTPVDTQGSGAASILPVSVARVLPDGTSEVWTTTRDCTSFRVAPCVVTDPIGRQTTYTYDPSNSVDLWTVTDTTNPAAPNQIAAFSGYVQHRPGLYWGPDQTITFLEHNSYGQLTAMILPEQPYYVYSYDSWNRLTEIDLNDTGQAQYLFTYDPTDSSTNVVTSTDATGETITYGYDAANRVRTEQFSDGTIAHFDYTLLDLTSIQDRVGNITTRSFYPDRHLESVVQSSRSTNYYYYPDGTLQYFTDPRCDQTTYTRDIEGRVQAVAYPAGPSESYTWDTAGRLLTDPTSTYTYNLDDTIQSIAYAGSAGSLTMNYDPNFRRLTSVVKAEDDGSAGATTTYSYNPFGSMAYGANKLATVTTIYPFGSEQADVVAYEYDNLDRIDSEAIYALTGEAEGLASQISTAFDSLGRVQTVTNNLDTFTYNYTDLSSRVTSISSGYGPAATLSYQPLPADPLLSEIHYTGNGNDPWLAYPATYGTGYDSDDRVASISSTEINRLLNYSYIYDSWSELTAKVNEGPRGVIGQQVSGYGYDPSGNLTSLSPDGAGAAASFSFNGGNQLSASSLDSPVPSYDSHGNVNSQGTAIYSWDSANRLASVVNGSTTSKFTYDWLGHLIRSVDTVSGAVTDARYVWDGGRIALKTDANGNALHIYYPQGFVALPGSQGPSGGYYYLWDEQGSVRQVWSGLASGAELENQYEYDPYGNLMQSDVGAPDEIQYEGYFVHPTTGLYFAEHRVYNPKYGRWLSRDPIGIAGGMNLYAYAGDNPTTLVDPSGLREVGQFEVDQILTQYSAELRSSSARYDLMYSEHSAGQPMDYLLTQSDDTFDVRGLGILNAGQFGNFSAGFGAGTLDTDLAYLGVRVGGAAYGLAAYGTSDWEGQWNYWGDTWESVYFINQGYSYASSGLYGWSASDHAEPSWGPFVDSFSACGQ
jgi:RHS repeat-associated protein